MDMHQLLTQPTFNALVEQSLVGTGLEQTELLNEFCT